MTGLIFWIIVALLFACYYLLKFCINMKSYEETRQMFRDTAIYSKKIEKLLLQHINRKVHPNQ